MRARETIKLPLERSLLWIPSSNRDLSLFPEPVQREMLTALEVARLGGKHPAAKPWHGEGPGVFEVAVDDGDAYRVVYTVHYREAVYVLHAFQKKSTQGIKTAQRDVETVGQRLRRAADDHKGRYGGRKKKQARRR